MLRFLCVMALGAAVCGTFRAAPALMPLPAKMETASGRLTIDAAFIVKNGGCTDARFGAVVARFAGQVRRQTGIPASNGPGAAGTLAIECTAGTQYPALGEDESYQLDVTPAGANLKAVTLDGVIHGLATFLQLIQPGAGGFEIPAVHIEDRPRFQWRGIMLDVSRHWMPVEVVERNLDAMSAVKFNVFHWHLSDDQGFRVESKLYPRLQQFGSDGFYYTQDQIRQVVAFARDRGIRVVPEFDIPGHTTSWFPGYPDLASAPGPFEIGRHFGVFDPVMDPTREETYTFLDGFIGEMAALFPDPFFHIGGDEVNGAEWTKSAGIQGFAKAHSLVGTLGIQTYFNQRILKILAKHGKTMVGWDEILGPDLPLGAVIQSWRGAKSLADAASKGYRGILSSGYYLDHGSTAAYHYAIDPLSGEAAQLTAEQSARILGGEACMWAEAVDPETVDSRIWPRAAAIAERLWSPSQVTDIDLMYARMEAVSRLLEWSGVRHRANYAPMLARLAGNRPAGPLRVLADVSEATGLGTGRRAGTMTSQTPLNRLVDAARMESESVRALEQAAARLVRKQATAGDMAQLRGQFTVWAGNDARFQPIAEENALLAETLPLSKDLSALGATGLLLLDYLDSGKPAPAAWVAGQTRELARMERPSAEVRLAAVRPVKVLLEAVASRR